MNAVFLEDNKAEVAGPRANRHINTSVVPKRGRRQGMRVNKSIRQEANPNLDVFCLASKALRNRLPSPKRQSIRGFPSASEHPPLTPMALSGRVTARISVAGTFLRVNVQ